MQDELEKLKEMDHDSLLSHSSERKEMIENEMDKVENI